MILQRLATIAPALVCGGIAIFSFVVAPTILGSFDSDISGPVMRSLFPNYYMVLGMTALVGALLALLAGRKGIALALLLILGGFCLQFFYILPTMETLRSVWDNPAEAAETITAARNSWGGWHGVSMSVNMLQFLISLVLVWMAQIKQRGFF